MYRCQYCLKSYTRQHDLKRHLGEKHVVTPAVAGVQQEPSNTPQKRSVALQKILVMLLQKSARQDEMGDFTQNIEETHGTPAAAAIRGTPQPPAAAMRGTPAAIKETPPPMPPLVAMRGTPPPPPAAAIKGTPPPTPPLVAIRGTTPPPPPPPIKRNAASGGGVARKTGGGTECGGTNFIHS